MTKWTYLAGVSAAALFFSTAAQAAVIEGRVSDQSGAVSLNGAIITIEETGISAVTGRDGRFRFTNLPAGDYTLITTYIGADPVETVVSIADAADTIATDVAMGADLSLMDNILVIGQRGSINSALNQQRSSDNIISVLSADAIGNFPDQNVTEAARRALGVSIENDQGEGRFVVIRGIDPNLNASAINGIRLPAPEGDTRAVALDVIDSEVLSSIEIIKSLTPDLDGDAIGGTVNIKTLSAFDRDERLLTGTIHGSYNEQADAFGNGISVTASDIFMEGRLGIAASASWRERTFATENLEAGGDWENEDGVFYNDELELRDYDVERERLNATLNLDFRATDDTTLFVRSLFSDFRDQEVRSVSIPEYDGDEFNADASGNNIALFDGGFEVATEIRDREETQQIWSVSVGGETFAGPWTFDYVVGYTHSEEDEPSSLQFVFAAEPDGVFGQNTKDGTDPRIVFGSQAERDAYLDPDNYEFDEAELGSGFTEDDEWSFKADAQYDTMFAGYPGFLKAGAKVRLREKSRNETITILDGFDSDDDLVLTPFAIDVDYPLQLIGPMANADRFRSFIRRNRDTFEVSDIDTAVESAIGDYEASEDIYAGYVMGNIDFGALSLIGGVRVEHTQFEASGNAIRIIEEGAIFDGVELEDDILFVDGTSGESDYTDVLPSITARYEMFDDVVLRGAYYRGIGRPNIEAIVPAAEIEENDENEVEGTLGNPTIDRQVADNLDFSAEWYFGPTSVIQAGVFYKNIKDFIALTVDEGTFAGFDGLVFDQAEIFQNVGDADVLGFEIGYQQALSFLPAPFDNLLIGANYTYVDSEIELPDGRTIALPKQSENVANLTFGYDDGRLDLRAALSYRDEYIDEIDASGDGLDRVVDDHLQIDLSGKYRINDQFRVFAEVSNLNDEPFLAFFRQDGRELLSQYEEYNYTVTLGLTYTH